MLNHCVTLIFGSVKMCSPAIFESLYHKDIWIAVTYYYIYLIVLFPLTAVLK